MKGKSNNRKEGTTDANYPPPPHVKKRFLAFLFAAALSAAFAGCSNGDTETMEYAGDNKANEPGVQTPAVPFYTITYESENDIGSTVSTWSVKAKEKAKINLPGKGDLVPPNGTSAFVGWNDGLLTYPAGYDYTVTKDVKFNARWAFDKLDKIETYLGLAASPVVIAVYGGVPKGYGDGTSLTWENLLSKIKAAGEQGKKVDLDLSLSTLALFEGTGGEKSFDYKDGNTKAYNTGERYIRKLVLPMDAKSITNSFSPSAGEYTFGAVFGLSELEAVSGLNVNAIPGDAFYGLSKLSAVAFPVATSIGDKAFPHCAKLTEALLPAATSIGKWAFYSCANLTSVSLPAATDIGEAAFAYCAELTEVSLPAAKFIGKEAFRGCANLTSVSLPAVISIGNNWNAFMECANLTSVSLPAATNIGDEAFSGLAGLTEVSLPAAKFIGKWAFRDCAKLTSVILPAATDIGEAAFSGLAGLTSVSLPMAKTIGEGTFKDCYNLTSVNLLAAEYINGNAFTGCAGLTAITIAYLCDIDSNSGMPHGFSTYYTQHEKEAGVYTYSPISSSWSHAPLGGTP